MTFLYLCHPDPMKSLLLLSLALPLYAKPLHPERWYQERVAAAWSGTMEVPVPDGRVDVLTRDHAIEVEFSSKWKEAIGQALWYALQTGRAAGIVLIIERPERDAVDSMRLETVVAARKLPIKVWRWPTDFVSLNIVRSGLEEALAREPLLRGPALHRRGRRKAVPRQGLPQCAVAEVRRASAAPLPPVSQSEFLQLSHTMVVLASLFCNA